MSSVWRKTLIYLGLVEEPDEHDELPEQLDKDRGSPARAAPARAERAAPAREPEPSRRPASFDEPPADVVDTRRERGRTAKADATNVRPLRIPEPGAAHVRAMAGYTAARVAVVHVSVFDNVEDVAARYRDGQPVLFDLSTADAADARRVLDFVSGTTYALSGALRRAGSRAFLLLPAGVEVPGDERERLATLGYAVDPEGLT